MSQPQPSQSQSQPRYEPGDEIQELIPTVGTDVESDDEHDVAPAQLEPFDVADVPAGLIADDGLTQKDLQAAMWDSRSGNESYVKEFNIQEVKRIPLSRLRTTFERNARSTAIGRLKSRHTVVVDDDLMQKTTDPLLAWSLKDHFLDFLLVVSGKIGLHAWLPSLGGDYRFHIEFDLTHRYYQWSAKHGHLGFDPTGRMLFVGHRGQEEIWIAMVPLLYTLYDEDEDTDFGAGHMVHLNAKSSCLTDDHYYMMVTFFATMFAANALCGIFCNETYPTPLRLDNIKRCTNVLGGHGDLHHKLELRGSDLRTLHQAIKERYEHWVRRAPPQWKEDGFLVHNVPISIAMRYGQNQQIAVKANFDAERNAFQQDRKYSCIKTISMALATHVSAIPVVRWVPIPPEEIRIRVGEVYDSPDPLIREEVDLDTFQLLDQHGHEVNIYGEDGFRIPRQSPRCAAGVTPCGILMDLNNLHELFSSDEDDFPEPPTVPNDDDDSDGENINIDVVKVPVNKVPFNIYPQAYLHQYGHYQAHGIFNIFKPILAEINNSLRRDPGQRNQEEEDADDADEVEDILGHGSAPIVNATWSQGYNQLSHHVRTTAKFHDVQLGTITSALAGTYATTDRNRRRATNQARKCEDNLPHNRYADKVGGVALPQSFRFETVIDINMSRMDVHDRCGR
ncbi:hypothetical protein BV22DRAFT_1135578 [Leucogyrophana mollusca]|uniref:Uncharacterized protein n=1 Tax=Leucogyrophana mollusca TaxID=85980 RepID=A0ACB8AVD8_9AGAM|nr:hypothetical protein BV22DRAFT_1135578 [Leucogyrophana mollusca]